MKLAADGSKIFLSRIVQVVANAAIVMLVAQTLGPTGQGHYSLTVALALLLAALLGGGMGLAAVPPLRRNVLPLTRMLKVQLLWIGVMIGVLGCLAWWGASGKLSVFLDNHLGWGPGLALLAGLAAAAILSFEIFSYDLLARGRLLVASAVNGTRAVIHLVAILGLVICADLTFDRAVAAFALAQVGGALVLLAVLLQEAGKMGVTDRKSVPLVAAGDLGGSSKDGDLLPPDLAERSLLGLIRFNMARGWLGQFSAVAYFLLLRLDQGFLEHFRGAAEVGVYSIAVHMGELLWLLPGALTPLLVHSSAGDDNQFERDQTALRAVRLAFLATLAGCLPLYLLAEPVITLLAGGSFQASGSALRALLPGILAFTPGIVLAGDFIGRGKPHWNTQASLATLIINILAALYLIPRYGAVGAGWASSLAYACGSGIMLWRFSQVTGLLPWVLTRSGRG